MTYSARAAVQRELIRQSVQPADLDFSLGRVLRSLADGETLSGFEAEVVSESNLYRGSGGMWGPTNVLPWHMLAQRDLTVASSTQGGKLVNVNEVHPAVQALRGFSVMTQAGITVLPGQQGDTVFPKVLDTPSGAWLTTESSFPSEANPTIGSNPTAPHTYCAYVDVSGKLLKTSQADAVIRRMLLQAVGRAIDAAIIDGSGLTGEPTGLLNTSGVGTVSGTSLAWAGILEAMKATTDAGASEATAWVGASDVRELLQARERIASTDSRTLWDEDRINNRPAHVSQDAPAGSLMYGDWSELVVALYGAGIEIQTDPYSAFTSYITRFRVMVTLDVQIPRAGAFVNIEDIT